MDRVDADWLKGRLGGKEGIFPAGFVNIIVDLDLHPKKTTSTTASGKLARALYDFDGQEGELSFKVQVISKKSVNASYHRY